MSMAALHPFSDAVVVMGVASCGKTTVAKALAQHLDVAFVEGDTLHGEANVAKMSQGIPLDDADRWPWLARVGKALQAPGGKIAACSALKQSYREAIVEAAGRPVFLIYLNGSADLLRQRIATRKGHFMPASLLDSQLATLQIPTSDERAITIDIAQSPERVVDVALKFLLQGTS
jgi:gluconokinase